MRARDREIRNKILYRQKIVAVAVDRPLSLHRSCLPAFEGQKKNIGILCQVLRNCCPAQADRGVGVRALMYLPELDGPALEL